MKRDRDIALIGCGRIGFLLEQDPLRRKPCSHFGGAAAAGLRITAACDLDEERLSLFGRTAGIGGDRLFTGHRALLDALRPTMVIISTWTRSHAEICVAAARAGARVIVLEKPVAASLTDARAILRACDRHSTRLIVNHERRYDGRYNALKKAIDRGVIGDITSVHGLILTGGHRGPSRVEDGGGPLLHDGTHLVDMVRFLFGEITVVAGSFTRQHRSSGFEDGAHAWLVTDRNVQVFLEAGGNRDYFVFELEIFGTRGKIVIGNGYEKLFRGRTSRLYTGFRDLAECPFPSYKTDPGCFTRLYREAKHLLADETLVPVSSGMDGYRALEAIHAVYESAHRGGTRIRLPLKPGAVDLESIFNL